MAEVEVKRSTWIWIGLYLLFSAVILVAAFAPTVPWRQVPIGLGCGGILTCGIALGRQ